jgi:hypothetical protein
VSGPAGEEGQAAADLPLLTTVGRSFATEGGGAVRGPRELSRAPGAHPGDAAAAARARRRRVPRRLRRCASCGLRAEEDRQKRRALRLPWAAPHSAGRAETVADLWLGLKCCQ